MGDQRIVRKADIRGLLRQGLAFLAVGLPGAGIGLAALFAPRELARRLAGLAGGLALLLFALATVAGARCVYRYLLYRRYFEATGLTKCSAESLRRWRATRDVTQ